MRPSYIRPPTVVEERGGACSLPEVGGAFDLKKKKKQDLVGALGLECELALTNSTPLTIPPYADPYPPKNGDAAATQHVSQPVRACNA